MFRSLSTCVLLLLLALPGVAFAQGTGTLAGRVFDGPSQEGLPGANVRIEGTQLGAATDIDGNYRIIGVPVGSYSVTASYAGYSSETIEGVSISNGYTRELSFTLQSGQELGQVNVVYERPIIQKDAIGAPRVVGAEDLENLPVRGVGAVTALQGSVVEGSSGLNIRGGREQEIQYFVDGVKVSGLVGVNQQAIQEQEMLIGSIPARYGDVQSGVVSITTKTGRQDFFGSIEGVTSRGLDSYGYNLGSLSLGGPVVPGRVGFFVSGEGLYREDSSPYGVQTYYLPDDEYNALQLNPQVLTVVNADGTQDFLPFDPGTMLTGPGIDGDSLQTLLLLNGTLAEGQTLGRGGALTSRAETFTADKFELRNAKDDPFGSLTFNGSLNFDLTSAVNLRLGAGLATTDNESRAFSNSLYNRDIFGMSESDSYRLYGTFRQRVSDQAFYQIQGEFQNFQNVSYPGGFNKDGSDLLSYGDIESDRFETARRYYVLNDGGYTQQFTDDSGQRPSRLQPDTFGEPGRDTPSGYSKSNNDQYRVSGNATTQVGVHQIEFGGEFEQETRRFWSIGAYGLAGFVNDGNLEQAAPEGFPDGVTSFDQLPYAQLRNRTTYYGYNFRGTEEVNSQNIDDFFDNAKTDLDSKNIDAYRPIYYAGYISDKIEYQDIVITAGLRVDVFDNNTQVLKDLYAPVPIIRAGDLGSAPAGIEPDYAVYFGADQSTVLGYRDLDGNFFDSEGTAANVNTIISDLQGTPVEKEGAARSEAFEAYQAQVTVMPRVGVSFPVTDRALFFASYDVVSQRPTERGFAPISSYDNLASLSFRTPNGNLQPEKTTQYQLGFRQRLGERAAISLAGFYRTQENKITNRPLNGSFPRYGTYLNQDFTTTQGAEVTFDLRRTNNLALTANYTLQYAQGTSSDANAVSNIVWRASPGDPFPTFISPATFDQRHTANVTLDYRLGEGEGPMLGGINAFENFGINLVGQFGSGQRYTRLVANSPAESFGVFDSFTTEALGSINSATLPATANFDLRIDRSFNLGFSDSRFRAYLLVLNVLNTRNTLAVYRGTGQPDNDGYPQASGALTSAGQLFNYQAYAFGPVNVGGNQSSSNGRFYSSPRQVRLGLLFDF